MGDVNIEVLDGGLGIAPASGDEVSAVIGCSSSGTNASVAATRSIKSLVAARGRGPGVQAAAFALKQTGKTILFCKANGATPGALSAVSSVGATGTSVHTVSGTPIDSSLVRFVWVKAGTRGTAGATFKYSLDNGESYSDETPIGTAVSYLIPNTGITVLFAAGTFIAGDTHTFTATEPKWNAAAVQACIAALKATGRKFRLIHLVGPLSASDAVTFSTEMASLATAYRFAGLLGGARDFAAADVTEAAWIAALAADYAAFQDSRTSVAAGHYLTPSPIDGWKYRRSLSYVLAARLMGRPIQEHAGRVRTGSLKGISANGEDGLIYHDSSVSDGLKVARFATARTRIGRPGFFIDKPAMMSSPSSDYQIWPHRSVIDAACDLTYEVLVDVLNDDLQLDPVTGYILEKEAKGIESRLKSAARDRLLSKRASSAFSATIKRDDNIISTSTLTCSIRVTPKGYAETINAEVGFTNPALELG